MANKIPIKSPNMLKRLGAVIVFLGVLTFAFASGLASYKDYTSLASNLRIASGCLLGLGVLLLIIHHRANILLFLRSRQAKYGANAFILTLSFIAIICLFNYLAHRHDARWDLTENKQFSLSDQSRNIVKTLDKKVSITAFYSANNATRQQTLDLLDTYKHDAPDKIEVEAIDPVRNPAKAAQFEVTTDGTTIFKSGTNTKTVHGSQEQDFTNALLSVTKENKPKIYFLQGHDELDPDSFDNKSGMGYLKQTMEKENYVIEKLFLIEKPEVPADARVLVIAGPEKPLTPQERDAVQKYIAQKAGDVLFLLKPQIQTGLESILEQYGIQVHNDLIIDPARHFWQDVAAPAITAYKYHEITKNMKAASFFPSARSIQLREKLPDNIKGTELTQTSPQSWGETDMVNTTQVKRDSTDYSGPLSLSAAVTVDYPEQGEKTKDEKDKKPPQSRIVVFGNSMFASNAVSRMLGNGDFFMNALAWLAEEEDLIGIRSKEPEQRQIELTNQQVSLIYNASIYGAPALMLILGGFIWWKRR